MVEINNISKKYGKKQALLNINLSVNDGSVVSVVGKNGSGKSTLLSIIAGVLKPSGGEVLLDGKNIIHQKRLAKKIGFVPQYNSLFEDLTVKENVKFWASASKIHLKNISENYFVKLLDLSEFQNKKVKNLSGGMKRRLTICASLIQDPEIIILDEPFAGLDLFYKSELIQYLKKLKDVGKTIIYTSHGTDEIADLSDFMYVINNGEIVLSADASQISSYGSDLAKVLIKLIKGEN